MKAACGLNNRLRRVWILDCGLKSMASSWSRSAGKVSQKPWSSKTWNAYRFNKPSGWSESRGASSRGPSWQTVICSGNAPRAQNCPPAAASAPAQAQPPKLSIAEFIKPEATARVCFIRWRWDGDSPPENVGLRTPLLAWPFYANFSAGGKACRAIRRICCLMRLLPPGSNIILPANPSGNIAASRVAPSCSFIATQLRGLHSFATYLNKSVLDKVKRPHFSRNFSKSRVVVRVRVRRQRVSDRVAVRAQSGKGKDAARLRVAELPEDSSSQGAEIYVVLLGGACQSWNGIDDLSRSMVERYWGGGLLWR